MRSDEDKKRRGALLLPIGRHITKVLEEKRRLGTDEGGRDAKWWFDTLWSYVGASMPGVTKAVEPQTVEKWYKTREAKVQAKKAAKSRQSPIVISVRRRFCA